MRISAHPNPRPPSAFLILENMVAEFTVSTALQNLGGCFGFGLSTKVINPLK